MVANPNTLMQRAEEEKMLRDLDKDLRMIFLVQGLRDSGQPGYAYVLVHPQRYDAFEHARQTGAHNIAEFGEVIALGPGMEPPADVQAWVEERFGADHLLQYKVARLIEESAAFA